MRNGCISSNNPCFLLLFSGISSPLVRVDTVLYLLWLTSLDCVYTSACWSNKFTAPPPTYQSFINWAHIHRSPAVTCIGLNPNYTSSLHNVNYQWMKEMEFTFIQPPLHNESPIEQSCSLKLISVQQTATTHPSNHQSYFPTLPSHSTWPSMLRKLASKAPSIVTNPAPAFVSIRKGTKPAQYCTSSPRKSLTDSDRKRICQYHVDKPFLTQTKIGGEFLEDDIRPSGEISWTGHL